ncbi:helix-turn-helix domain-containing protein [Nonomuraea sp. NPDC000554]|uniref:helix-turn-helix domain-containing protein n=1 Tax=Nonomuraea sp. NPDC000554 TaxID=3154259 RepID=UPI00332CB77A
MGSLSVDSVNLLLHPLRLRIVHAMSGRRTLTPTQLSARLPDVSRTSLYRHVGLLADAGVLTVDGEQRVRGVVERSYRLNWERAAIDADMAASMSPEDHRRGFLAAMAALLAEFNAYLDRDDADPVADSVGYRQLTLWLSKDELTEIIDQLREILLSHANNQPTPDRSPHLLSPIVFPTEQPFPTTAGNENAR